MSKESKTRDAIARAADRIVRQSAKGGKSISREQALKKSRQLAIRNERRNSGK